MDENECWWFTYPAKGHRLNMNNYRNQRPRLQNRQMSPQRRSNLLQDKGLFEWMKEQDWSEFAQSLASFYEKNGGFTEKQFESARSMRLKLDEFYDPHGRSVENGVYIDEEEDIIFKLSWLKKDDYKSRSLRSRKIDSPNWREVKNGFAFNKRDEFFDDVISGRIRLLSEDELIKIGRSTGICCVCGKTLDNPSSIAAGIGPYCAKQQKEGY